MISEFTAWIETGKNSMFDVSGIFLVTYKNAISKKRKDV